MCSRSAVVGSEPRAFSPHLVLAAGIVAAACGSYGGHDGPAQGPPPPEVTGYVPTHLVSDVGAPLSPGADAQLVNAWGIATSPGAFAWVTNNGTSTSTQYDGDGPFVPLVVALPPGSSGDARPTGVVFNDTDGFRVTRDGRTGRCAFLVAGEGGTVACWAPGVNALETAIVTADDGRARYTGLAIATQGSASFLYAADFRNGRVDVFDSAFTRVDVAGGFVDPGLPEGYAPYGVQGTGDLVYVAYARQDPRDRREVTGAGLGVVDVFDVAGTFIRRLASEGGPLDTPWGMAIAPGDFGAVGGALLVSSFGDGRIDALDPVTGAFLGALSEPDGTPIAIEGLRGIAFGENLFDQPPGEALYFVAGPGGGTHGLYGRIERR